RAEKIAHLHRQPQPSEAMTCGRHVDDDALAIGAIGDLPDGVEHREFTQRRSSAEHAADGEVADEELRQKLAAEKARARALERLARDDDLVLDAALAPEHPLAGL